MATSVSPYMMQILQMMQNGQGGQNLGNSAPQIPVATAQQGSRIQSPMPQQQQPQVGAMTGANNFANTALNGQKLYNAFGGNPSPTPNPNAVTPTQNASGMMGSGSAYPSQASGPMMSPSMAYSPNGFAQGGMSVPTGMYGPQSMPGSLAGSYGASSAPALSGVTANTAATGGAADAGAADATASAAADSSPGWLSSLWALL